MIGLERIVVHGTRVRPCVTSRRVEVLTERLERVLRIRLTGSIACTCVTDTVMRRLNNNYRNKDRTTDVLSFLYSEQQKGRERTIVGDIILSPRVAARQAKERGTSVHAVIDELVVHALLHLLGYDHERSKKDEKIMFDVQKRILTYS